MRVDVTHHFPPDLMLLLKDTIPLLCRSKRDLITFFIGAGVAKAHYGDLADKVRADRNSVNKYEIVRIVLERLNENREEDYYIRTRREVLKRVVEFKDFATCWDEDRLKARGLVAQIQQLTEEVIAVTQIRMDREKERQRNSQANEAKVLEKKERSDELAKIKAALFALFGESDVWKRGKALEKVLNDYFAWGGIQVCEEFTIRMDNGKPLEQVDGVIEIDGMLYLVEMKWWEDPIGVPEIAQHVMRITKRGKHVRGLFVSYSAFADSAIEACKEQYPAGIFITLCTLQEIVTFMEREANLKGALKAKINASILKQRPLTEIDFDSIKKS